jgi:hypothetical protein
VDRSLCREDGSVVYNCSWSLPAQTFSGPTPMGLVSDSRLPFSSPPTTRRITVEVFDPASFYNFRTNRIETTISNSSRYSVLIRCCGNVPREPMSSNGRLCGASLTVHLRRSGVMSQYTVQILWHLKSCTTVFNEAKRCSTRWWWYV